MKLLSTSTKSRIYMSNDLTEAYEFVMKFNGKFIPDYNASLQGIFYVII